MEQFIIISAVTPQSFQSYYERTTVNKTVIIDRHCRHVSKF